MVKIRHRGHPDTELSLRRPQYQTSFIISQLFLLAEKGSDLQCIDLWDTVRGYCSTIFRLATTS